MRFFAYYLRKQLKYITFAIRKRRGGGTSFLFLVQKSNMIDKEHITGIVNSYLEGTDRFLVEVAVRPGNIIVVEIDSDSSIGIDDCVKLSKEIESHFDRETEDFELEVGSAGISSPFKIARQYTKNVGKEIEVLTLKGEKFTGVLKNSDDQGFTVTVTKMEKPEGAKRKVVVEKDFSYKYEEIKYTKYLIRFK